MSGCTLRQLNLDFGLAGYPISRLRIELLLLLTPFLKRWESRGRSGLLKLQPRSCKG